MDIPIGSDMVDYTVIIGGLLAWNGAVHKGLGKRVKAWITLMLIHDNCIYDTETCLLSGAKGYGGHRWKHQGSYSGKLYQLEKS